MTSKLLFQLGEFGLIDRIKKLAKVSPAVIQAIGDDAAVLPWTRSKYLLLTTDMLVEGAHFAPETPGALIGYKAMAVNISDIAAMGGVPRHAVVSFGVPRDLPADRAMDLYRGMLKAARHFKVDLVGGDTVRSDKMVINIAMTGEAGKRDVVYRRGAKAGDEIFVTGPLGRSLSTGWHLRFLPRVAASQYLIRRARPTAMIDISDGLAGDLGHILSQSGVGAVIEEALVPRRDGATLHEALYDGEDFELLFTLRLADARRLAARRGNKFSFIRIGWVVPKGQGLTIKGDDGKINKIHAQGYTHF